MNETTRRRQPSVPSEPIPSRTTIAGHPLHPMIVHFPVAALLGLVGADGAYLYTGDPFWSRAGVWLAGVGTVGGWIASAVGLIDLLFVGRIRRLVSAWSHALIAVMMLSIATLNWALRLGVDAGAAIRPWGLTLSLLTSGFIVLAAYLGGRLVYEHAIAVDTQG